jgi:hypothetical protein
MHICIDSSVFVRGIKTRDATIATIFSLVGDRVALSIPRLVANEVTRNLNSPRQIRAFYELFQQTDVAIIVDEPVPESLVQTYVSLGLPAKADAFIGAFAEWKQVDCLLSDNRHFLRQLHTAAFEVLDPAAFMSWWRASRL